MAEVTYESKSRFLNENEYGANPLRCSGLVQHILLSEAKQQIVPSLNSRHIIPLLFWHLRQKISQVPLPGSKNRTETYRITNPWSISPPPGVCNPFIINQNQLPEAAASLSLLLGPAVQMPQSQNQYGMELLHLAQTLLSAHCRKGSGMGTKHYSNDFILTREQHCWIRPKAHL